MRDVRDVGVVGHTLSRKRSLKHKHHYRTHASTLRMVRILRRLAGPWPKLGQVDLIGRYDPRNPDSFSAETRVAQFGPFG